MSKTDAMISKRKQASALALDRVHQELRRCHDNGEVISMAELARRARVSRTSIYRNPAMAGAIEQGLGAVTVDLAQRAERDGRTTATSLRTDLSNAKATIRRQVDQVAALERALSQAMGHELLGQLPRLERVALESHDDRLHELDDALLALADTRASLREREEELDAARLLNRELTLQVNRRSNTSA
jgi:hypothetical protein